MAVNQPTRKAIKEKRANLKRELANGEPALGAQGPEGSKFLGWILVQVWEPQPRSGRSSVTVNWSGNEVDLFPSAAAELQSLAKGI
jgi:hypothetical protein